MEKSDRRTAFRSIGAMLADLATSPVPGAATARPAGRPARRWQRPPGAGSEAQFLLDCTSCGDCANVCPHAAIGVLPAEAGKAAGTPAMDTARNPCHLCETMPCIGACEPGALMPIEPHEMRLGLAEIDESRCFAFQGPECGSCVSACPIKAIKNVAFRPKVDDEVCTGCGLCVDSCPVWGGVITIRA